MTRHGRRTTARERKRNRTRERQRERRPLTVDEVLSFVERNGRRFDDLKTYMIVEER